jgi:hypothetical protein
LLASFACKYPSRNPIITKTYLEITAGGEPHSGPMKTWPMR